MFTNFALRAVIATTLRYTRDLVNPINPLNPINPTGPINPIQPERRTNPINSRNPALILKPGAPHQSKGSSFVRVLI